MALDAGTVTVVNQGNVSGTGLAWDMFQAQRVPLDAMLDQTDPDTDRTIAYAGLAAKVVSDAAVLINYLVANTVVTGSTIG